ncbi:MAG: GAF domain-containing protein [Symploca sp. SIO2C1]|nr:GAF domain-containing protein [Symploca sp. SIO2C1]
MSKSFSVHPKYIQKFKSAWRQKIDEGGQNLLEELGLSPSVVSMFLRGQPVNSLNFVGICHILGLDWREIAGLDIKSEQMFFPTPERNLDYITPTREISTVDEALGALVETLCEMLRRLTRKAGDVVGADRTSIFLLDQQTNTLGSINAEDGHGGSLVIDIPSNRGIASLAVASSQVINIPFDVYDDPRSEEAQKTDQRTGYRTYTMLAWPLFNEQKNIVAVVQLINKLKRIYNPEDYLSRRIDTNGFNEEDEVVFAKFAPSILQTLERCQFCYQLTQKLKDNTLTNEKNVVVQQSELVAELQFMEQQLHRNLDRI